MPRPARLLSRAATIHSFVSYCSCSSFPAPDDLLSAKSGKLLRVTRGIDTKSVVPRHWARTIRSRFQPVNCLNRRTSRAGDSVERFARACSLAATMRGPPGTSPLISTGSRLECEALHAIPQSPASQTVDSGNIASACDSLNGSRNMSRRRWRPRKRSASSHRTSGEDLAITWRTMLSIDARTRGVTLQ